MFASDPNGVATLMFNSLFRKISDALYGVRERKLAKSPPTDNA